MNNQINRSICFRVDFGSELGLGHLMRCVNIATKIKTLALVDIKFIVARYSDDGLEFLTDNKFNYFLQKNTLDKNKVGIDNRSEIEDAKKTQEFLNEDDIIILDSYLLGKTWESFFLKKGQKVCAIDDIDRTHHVNLLLDYSFWKTKKSHYLGSEVLDYKLIGSSYIPLKESITSIKRVNKDFEKPNLLISFGGKDEINLTLQILKLINYEKFNKITVIQLSNSKNTNNLNRFIGNKSNISLYSELTNIADIYKDIDICIGGGGVSAIERCFLGIPSLVVIQASNQEDLIKNLYNENLIGILNINKNAEENETIIDDFLDNKRRLNILSKNGRSFFVDNGSLEVAKKIVRLLDA